MVDFSEIQRLYGFIPTKDGKPYDPGPPPPPELGRNLKTIEDARIWLTHPGNWHRSEIYIVKWNGSYPTLNWRNGQYIIDRPDDTGLLEVVIWQQRQLKHGRKFDPIQIGANDGEQ